MGTEILLLIVLPGLFLFVRLAYKALTKSLPDSAVYLAALLGAVAFGLFGMVKAYNPDIPENWNTSFIVGWFLMSVSIGLIGASICAALVLYLWRKLRANRGPSDSPTEK
ncbi:MAG: hypothetical protein V4607_06060 [Pseudomonadota bacterium]